MDMNPLITSLLLFTLPVSVATVRRCDTVDSCSCKFIDTGAMVSVRSLGHQDGSPLFRDIPSPDGTQYSYNPCFPFDEVDCHNSAICETGIGQNSTYLSLASQSSVFYSFDGHNIQITYLSEKGPTKMSVVSYVCVEGLAVPRFTAYGKNATSSATYYYFRLESQCACEAGCQGNGDKRSPGGVNPGLMALLAVAVVTCLYFSVGVMYGKLVRKATGLQVLPHWEMWSSLPSLIKLGCRVTMQGKCCSGGTRPVKAEYDEVNKDSV